MTTIFTLGTSLRGTEDFIEIIKAYEIQIVIDVRSYPSSRLEHFKRNRLKPWLENEGIEYHYLGRELGGYRKGGYEQFTQTEEFAAGVETLKGIASTGVSVIICAERFPWKCHRKFIARELQRQGWKVMHIIDKGKVWTPE